MANDKLMTYEQGSDMITKLNTIAANISQINKNIDLGANKVTSMAGYTLQSDASNITTSDTLNQAVSKLEKRVEDNKNNILSLLPTSYSLPTLIDDTTCTINDGGYITVGNIIVVNVTFTTSVSYTAYGSIMQFPVPKNSGSITMVAAAHIDSSVNVAVNKFGQLALFDASLPAGTYHFFTVYLKQ